MSAQVSAAVLGGRGKETGGSNNPCLLLIPDLLPHCVKKTKIKGSGTPPSVFPVTAGYKGVLQFHFTASEFLQAGGVHPSQISLRLKVHAWGCVRSAVHKSCYEPQELTPITRMKMAVVCFADCFSGQTLPSSTFVQP